MRHVFHSKGLYNSGAISDPEIDSLIDQSRTELDPNKRRDLFWQAMKIIMDKAYSVYIIGLPEIWVMQNRVQGFIPSTEPVGAALQWQWRRLWLSA